MLIQQVGAPQRFLWVTEEKLPKEQQTIYIVRCPDDVENQGRYEWCIAEADRMRVENDGAEKLERIAISTMWIAEFLIGWERGDGSAEAVPFEADEEGRPVPELLNRIPLRCRYALANFIILGTAVSEEESENSDSQSLSEKDS